jgi:ribosomal protein L4
MKQKLFLLLKSLDFETPKTKSFVDVVTALGLEWKKILVCSRWIK